ncbi:MULTISPECIES: 2-hydroxyacid dehydrogenase [Leeia]|uniref:Glyoxylate/hydroxypyruvate reductase A n=1 Tax=Leeia aquatica TaxID=2725557 RepID=A0A847SDE6_9NEIS|nr:glyoxylate/hydroxypyruvate reductase A [Leeia aquatica]NLR75339.1 glyoxylate/hydroxypyruvate reductase A [Leeia aquatica]
MRILVYSPNHLDEWLAETRQHFPEADVQGWPCTPDWQADYALLWKPPAELFQQQNTLKAVFVLGAGVDAQLPLIPDSLPLYRLEDSGMGEQMADYVSHYLLRWFYRYDAYQLQHHWQPGTLDDKARWRVTILGYGAMGSAVAERVRQLGFPVQAWRRQPAGDAAIPVHAGLDALPACLGSTRVLVNLLPLTPETRGLLNQQRLSQLPPDSYLINLARGAHVVDEDLLAALDSGHLAGATLDVFQHEPLPAEHRYWQHPKVNVTPHIGALTPLPDALQQIQQKLGCLLQGLPAGGLVDRHRGY